MMKKRMVALILAMLFCVSASISAFAFNTDSFLRSNTHIEMQADTNMEDKTNLDDESLLLEISACNAYSNLMNFFTNEEGISYPSYYSGVKVYPKSRTN